MWTLASFQIVFKFKFKQWSPTDLNHSKTRLLVDFPTLILILHIWHLKSCEPVKSAHVNATEIGFNNCEQSPREKFAGGRRAECNMPTVSYKTVKSKFIELWAKYKHLKDYIKKKMKEKYWSDFTLFSKMCNSLYDIKGSPSRISSQGKLYNVKITTKRTLLMLD